jgi:F0F1-type ATP synthase membrane subunit b/b'
MDFSTVLDPIFIAKVIDFALLIGAIWYLYQRFGSAYLVVQQEAQNKAVEDAVAQLAAAENAVAVATHAILQAQLDAARMLETGKAQAARLIVEERNAALERAQRILAHASGELERERYRVRIELLEDTVERATSHARDIIKRDGTPAKQHGLVESLLGGLEARHA